RVRGAHLLDVIARVPLEPRRSLYVVEVAGKTLLVGTSEMGLSVLSELDGGEVRARAVDRPSFGELVRAAWSRRRGLRGDGAAGGAGGRPGGGWAADPGGAGAVGEAARGGAVAGVAEDRGGAAEMGARGRAGREQEQRRREQERRRREQGRRRRAASSPPSGRTRPGTFRWGGFPTRTSGAVGGRERRRGRRSHAGRADRDRAARRADADELREDVGRAGAAAERDRRARGAVGARRDGRVARPHVLRDGPGRGGDGAGRGDGARADAGACPGASACPGARTG